MKMEKDEEVKFVPTMETILDMLYELTCTDECSKDELESIHALRITVGALCIHHRKETKKQREFNELVASLT